MSEVIISRESADYTRQPDGSLVKKYDCRVYVTGPHFGGDIFSSTLFRAEASRFTREQAEEYIREGKWRSLRPELEEA